MVIEGDDIMPTITLRTSDQERQLITQFAEFHGKSLSQYIKDIVLEKIEDEYDLKKAEEAYEEYLTDSTTYTLEEFKQRHGL